jgi:excinuclease ABC subunit C
LSFFDLKALSRYSEEPGVYLMKNQAGLVVYVGKAKSLRRRLKQYFYPGRDGRAMVPFLAKEIATIDTIIVSNEKDAILLENTLIKKHQPKYNILLKDDKTFVSLTINYKHPWPMIKLTRSKGGEGRDVIHFGPYISSYAARQTLELMHRIFPLRQCSDEEFKRRRRPCILYEMKRCLAPCVGKCFPAEYKILVDQASDFLRGNSKAIIEKLKVQIQEAAENLEYEKAAAILEMMRNIKDVTTQGHRVVSHPSGEDSDAIALYRQGSAVALAQMFFQKGSLIDSKKYLFSNVIEGDEELLISFILQYYKNLRQKPQKIFIPVEVSSCLQEIVEISIVCPKIGDKKKIVGIAQKNAEDFFNQEKDEGALTEKVLIDLQKILHLQKFPSIIECFDTSNTLGSDFVASKVTFINGKYERKKTRFFKIQKLVKGDDCAALYQTIKRRIIRGKKDGDLPDLIIIDGGKGQLSSACKAMEEENVIGIDLFAIAKENSNHSKGITQEQVFLQARSDPVCLPVHSPIIFFLQRIRDEAHRVAITFHRKVRSQRTIFSEMDTVVGIGPVKKKKLLKVFGSYKQLLATPDSELLKISGITAKDIYNIRNQIKKP